MQPATSANTITAISIAILARYDWEVTRKTWHHWGRFLHTLFKTIIVLLYRQCHVDWPTYIRRSPSVPSISSARSSLPISTSASLRDLQLGFSLGLVSHSSSIAYSRSLSLLFSDSMLSSLYLRSTVSNFRPRGFQLLVAFFTFSITSSISSKPSISSGM